MAREDSPPFARGETYYNGGIIDPSDPLGLGGVNLEGREYLFEVNAPDDPVGADPSGRQVRVKVVRNKSGVNLLPKRIARYRTNSDSPLETAIDSYTTGVGDVPAGVIDEFLPAAGVPPNDLFYIVLAGPTQVITEDTGAVAVAIGTILVPATGTGSLTADAGKVVQQDLTGTTAALGNNVQNKVGRSNAAATTNTATISIVAKIK